MLRLAPFRGKLGRQIGSRAPQLSWQTHQLMLMRVIPSRNGQGGGLNYKPEWSGLGATLQRADAQGHARMGCHSKC